LTGGGRVILRVIAAQFRAITLGTHPEGGFGTWIKTNHGLVEDERG
jgi:hypothetical protein